jgi:hypothetical protein
MLSTLKEYIVGIGELFISLYHFVLDFFGDVVYVVKLTASGEYWNLSLLSA